MANEGGDREDYFCDECIQPINHPGLCRECRLRARIRELEAENAKLSRAIASWKKEEELWKQAEANSDVTRKDAALGAAQNSLGWLGQDAWENILARFDEETLERESIIRVCNGIDNTCALITAALKEEKA